MMLSVLIVDDEPLARERIRSLLAGMEDIRIEGECATGTEARAVLLRSTVDLMFLDIQMPEMDGPQLLESLPQDRVPMVIFTTAYDAFAVKAFELNAADYLLKPFTKKRFLASLDRVRERFLSADKDLFLSRMLTTVRSVALRQPYADRIVVKTDGTIRFLTAADIRWIESDANYLRLHTAQGALLIRETLTNFSQRLDPALFLRLHRTVIVNTAFLKELKPWFNDETVALLQDGTQLPVGRTYRKAVMKFFGM